MMGRALRFLWPLVLGLILFSGQARADELSEEVDVDEAVYAVQNRLLLKGHEFSVSLGVLPLDALHKGITLGVGYTYHFNSVIGWQIAHFRYAFNVDTPTVAELDRSFGVVASSTPRVEYLLDSSVLFKILSGKAVLGSSRIVGGEISAIVGPALSVLNVGNSCSSGQCIWGFNVGLGFRAFLSRYFSASLEVREYELFQASPTRVTNVFDISLGASLNLR